MSKITYESDISFERRSFFGNIVYRYMLQPILNRLPAKAQTNVRKSHKFADEMVTHKTSHRALDIIYSDSLAKTESSLKSRLAYAIWRNTDNVIGVRNRLRIVEREISSFLANIKGGGTTAPIRMLSIASGSSRSFVDVLKKYECPHTRKIDVTFLDKSTQALEYSKGLIESNKEHYCDCFQFNWVEGTANTYLRNLSISETFDVIEMVGLLDYFDDEKFVDTVREIHAHLVQGGVLLIGNILPNREERFITNVVDWKMIYRTPEQLVQLTQQALSTPEAITVFVEPLCVHAVVRAVKK